MAIVIEFTVLVQITVRTHFRVNVALAIKVFHEIVQGFMTRSVVALFIGAAQIITRRHPFQEFGWITRPGNNGRGKNKHPNRNPFHRTKWKIETSMLQSQT
jgi:hypothetical protein